MRLYVEKSNRQIYFSCNIRFVLSRIVLQLNTSCNRCNCCNRRDFSSGNYGNRKYQDINIKDNKRRWIFGPHFLYLFCAIKGVCLHSASTCIVEIPIEILKRWCSVEIKCNYCRLILNYLCLNVSPPLIYRISMKTSCDGYFAHPKVQK